MQNPGSKANDDLFQFAKFMEHWGMILMPCVAIVSSQVILFFMNLTGARWIWFFYASFALMALGGALIVRAKFPVYRSGRFFTLGIKSVPEELAGFYRWGWLVFLFGSVVALCLLMSKP